MVRARKLPYAERYTVKLDYVQERVPCASQHGHYATQATTYMCMIKMLLHEANTVCLHQCITVKSKVRKRLKLQSSILTARNIFLYITMISTIIQHEWTQLLIVFEHHFCKEIALGLSFLMARLLKFL